MIASTRNSSNPNLKNYTKSQSSPAFINFKKMIQPFSSLEAKLLDQPEFSIGLNWGVPRFGHPEGKVGFHIIEVLNNIEQLGVDEAIYQKLRLVALLHDTFKYQEDEMKSKGKRINHGMLARQYSEKYLDDEATLDLIELHDEIYYAWRQEALYGTPQVAAIRLDSLMKRIGNNLRLHYLFFRCDTMTGDKVQAPRIWFEQRLKKTGGESFEKLLNQLNGFH